ncbi:MAG: formimidoylglutamase [Pirellulales bacterium]|nr:formimidoylglutamase [Pirellulales bacterium]
MALLGLPDDNGVQLNNGRPGAADGPKAFRAALAGYGTNWDAAHRRELDMQVFDAGDVEPAAGRGESAMFETHARVERVVGELHQIGLMPICIGGGHDLSLPGIEALAKHSTSAVGGINFDAHLDVRQTIGSGMAFRRLIEQGLLDPRRFIEAGLGPFANDRCDCEWLIEQGGQIIFEHEIFNWRELDEQNPLVENWLSIATDQGTQAAFCSIDLDALNSAFAPGVSAINPLGLEVRHAVALARLAGANSQIRHFDIMELSPPHDLDGRTARVAALLFLCFLSGWRTRLV